MSKKAKRIRTLLKGPRDKSKLMRSVNRIDQDGLPPANAKDMTTLKDIESPNRERDQHIQDIGPKVTVY